MELQISKENTEIVFQQQVKQTNKRKIIFLPENIS